MQIVGAPNVEILKAIQDIDGLLIALSYPDDQQIRRDAAFALAELKAAPALKELLLAAKDENVDMRCKAVTALGSLGDPAAVWPLIFKLKDEDWQVRAAAVAALERIGDARGVEPILLALKNDDRSEVRAKAAGALGKFADNRIVDALLAACADMNPEVYSTAEAALIRLGKPVVPDLVAALHDRNRSQIARNLLVQMGEPAVDALKTALVDDVEIRSIVIEILKQLKWQPDTSAAGLEYCLITRKWNLMTQMGPAAVDPLRKILSEGEWEDRRKAATVLGEIKDVRAVEPLIQALKDQNSDVRMAVVEALGLIPDKRSTQPLQELSKDWDPRVQLAAVNVLKKINAH